jgi:4-hydroxybenzoate polyprenyltransferase
MKVEPLHQLWGAVSTAMASWHQGKLFIEHAVRISHDTLHLIFGVLIWLVVALVSRRPLTSWTPWLWALAFILWNEASDLWNEHWPDAGQQYGEGAKDIALTMFVPTLLMMAARFRPDLFRAAPQRRSRK